MKFSNIYQLIKKDAALDFRQKYAVSSIMLYVIGTVFIMYKVFNTVDAQSWNALFWIIFLFTGVNALMKSFYQEGKNRAFYYFSLADPNEIIIAKMS